MNPEICDLREKNNKETKSQEVKKEFSDVKRQPDQRSVDRLRLRENRLPKVAGRYSVLMDIAEPRPGHVTSGTMSAHNTRGPIEQDEEKGEARGEEGLVPPVQETQPPAIENLQSLRLKRDIVEQYLANLNNRISQLERTQQRQISSRQDSSPLLQLNLTLSTRGIPERQLSYVCDVLNDQPHENLREYASEIHFDPGSIKITLKITSAEQLQNLVTDMKNGVLLEKLKQNVLKAMDSLNIHDDGDSVIWSIEYSSEHLGAIEKIFKASILEDDVDFTFCSERQSWFWSPGDEYWFSCKVPIVTKGQYKGKIPKDADMALLTHLQELNHGVTTTDNNCIICQKGADNDEVIENFMSITLSPTIIMEAGEESCKRPEGRRSGRPSVDLLAIEKMERVTLPISENLSENHLRGLTEKLNCQQKPVVSCNF